MCEVVSGVPDTEVDISGGSLKPGTRDGIVGGTMAL